MVVAKAQELGSYENLEKNEKELLIETLAAARVAKDTGIVQRPLVCKCMMFRSYVTVYAVKLVRFQL